MSAREALAERERQADGERREAEAHLHRAFQFLVDDFGYEYIGPIALTTDSVVLRGYVNRHAGVQVELSGNPGGTLTGLFRKMKDGVPAPYDHDHYISFGEVALVRSGKHDHLLSHDMNPDGWHGVVARAAQLCKENPLLLIGKDWIPRERLAAAWSRDLGFTVDPEADGSWPLNIFKSNFAFLADHGYRIVFDTSLLTPHEYLVTKELRYESEQDVVRIHCVDFRDGEWAVDRNGRRIGGIFHPGPEEIEAVARLVAAEFR